MLCKVGTYPVFWARPQSIEEPSDLAEDGVAMMSKILPKFPLYDLLYRQKKSLAVVLRLKKSCIGNI